MAVKKVRVNISQAGIILLEVLPMLALLGIIGVAFVSYSTTGR
jgi:hypothetical protein